MPELPEVEIASRYVNMHLQGKKLVSFVHADGKVTTYSQIPLFDHSRRDGKHIIISFRDGPAFVVHLKIAGSFVLIAEGEALPKYTRMTFCFDDGSALCFMDPRKFIVVAEYPDLIAAQSHYTSQGIDALEVNAGWIYGRYKKDKRPIKIALMDQGLVKGMGNIYVSEALFDAGLSPFMPIRLVSKNKLDAVFASNRIRMISAIEEGKKLIGDTHFYLRDGWMDLHLSVYQREGHPCPRCHMPIKRVDQAGRGTYYCPNCQKAHKGPFVVGITGPIHSGKSTVAKMLQEQGFMLIDCDELAHRYYETEAGKAKIREIFSKTPFDEQGNVDINEIRKIVASSKASLNRLQQSIFVYVRAEARKMIKEAPKDAKIVLDVPLIVTGRMTSYCDYIVLVDADIKTRQSRIEEEGRDASSLMKINADYPLEKTRKAADTVIHNDGDLGSLKNQLFELGLLQ